MNFPSPCSGVRTATDLLAPLLIFLTGIPLIAARADVIVLANRTPSQMTVVVTPPIGGPQQVVLPAGDSTPVFVNGRAHVEFASRGQAKRYLLDVEIAVSGKTLYRTPELVR